MTERIKRFQPVERYWRVLPKHIQSRYDLLLASLVNNPSEVERKKPQQREVCEISSESITAFMKDLSIFLGNDVTKIARILSSKNFRSFKKLNSFIVDLLSFLTTEEPNSVQDVLNTQKDQLVEKMKDFAELLKKMHEQIIDIIMQNHSSEFSRINLLNNQIIETITTCDKIIVILTPPTEPPEKTHLNIVRNYTPPEPDGAA